MEENESKVAKAGTDKKKKKKLKKTLHPDCDDKDCDDKDRWLEQRQVEAEESCEHEEGNR